MTETGNSVPIAPLTANNQDGSDEPWSVGRLVRWVADDLRARGFESPKLEADLLVSRALGCDRIRLIIDRERVLDEAELERLRGLVRRRRKHEPVAYLMGEREFYGRCFRVDRRVLVPRPDTETLLDVVLERTRHMDIYGRLLDLCTGSGNVALSFARERPTWRVDATDISADALAVARENALRLGTVWNVRFAMGDLFSAAFLDGLYDAITANAPYIPSDQIGQLAVDIREHEPRLALDGGKDGLDVVRRIVGQAPKFLSRGGVLALEVGAGQHDDVLTLMRANGYTELQCACDLGNIPRVVSGVWTAEP